jgi:hypothetical protein
MVEMVIEPSRNHIKVEIKVKVELVEMVIERSRNHIKIEIEAKVEKI